MAKETGRQIFDDDETFELLQMQEQLDKQTMNNVTITQEEYDVLLKVRQMYYAQGVENQGLTSTINKLQTELNGASAANEFLMTDRARIQEDLDSLTHRHSELGNKAKALEEYNITLSILVREIGYLRNSLMKEKKDKLENPNIAYE